jgi:hypothetical protein
MSRPSFRVFVTRHHGGLTSAVLLRRYRLMFDQPPPAAMAEDLDTALTRLAPQAALIAESAERAGMMPESIWRFSDSAAAATEVPRWLREGDLVLLKASRGIHLEMVAQAIMESRQSGFFRKVAS